MVPRALEAAERLSADHGIDAEVIDLRSLVPLDVGDDPPIGREDEPAVHRRGEPAALRLGRRDRLDRRRRGLLQPRRPDRPDHDAARAAAERRDARGRRDPERRPDRRHRPRPPGGARSDDRRRRRDRADGLRDDPRAARRRTRGRSSTTGPAPGPTSARSRPGRRSRRRPADVAARADVTLTMLADDGAVRDVYRGPGRPARGGACRRRPRRPEHGHPGHDPIARGRRRGRPARGSSTRRSRAASRSPSRAS